MKKPSSIPLEKKLLLHLFKKPFWYGLVIGGAAGVYFGQEMLPKFIPILEVGAKVGFSPEGRALEEIESVINTAQYSIHLSAYAYTSERVTAALLRASRRGVVVQLTIDHHHNFESGMRLNASAARALSPLLEAGISVHTNQRYRIHHDKFLIVDRKHIETGSFNFTRAAAESNSENCLILYNVPEIAEQYLKHWETRYEQGRPLSLSACQPEFCVS